MQVILARPVVRELSRVQLVQHNSRSIIWTTRSFPDTPVVPYTPLLTITQRHVCGNLITDTPRLPTNKREP